MSRNTAPGKLRGKSNGSILSFFKKAESPQKSRDIVTEEDNSLFFEDAKAPKERYTPTQTPTPPRDAGDLSSDEATTRYNEEPLPSKRRRTNEISQTASKESGNSQTALHSHNNPDLMISSVTEAVSPELRRPLSSCDPTTVDTPVDEIKNHNARSEAMRHGTNAGPFTSNGPFVEDSESEDEMIKHLTRTTFNGTTPRELVVDEKAPIEVVELPSPEHSIPVPPILNREATSIVGGDDFDGMDDFIDDEFPADGEEYMERVWMDEQEGLEIGSEENKMDEDSLVVKDEYINDTAIDSAESQSTETCPLCSLSLAGVPSEVGFSLYCATKSRNTYSKSRPHLYMSIIA